MKVLIESKNLELYAIFLNKVEGIELSKSTIDKHIEHLKSLDEKDCLVLCGPFSDYPSGMVVVKATNKDEAVSIAKKDPFVKEGVRSFEVRTWQIASKLNGYLG